MLDFTILKKFFLLPKQVTNFIYPPLCIACNTELTSDLICESCWESIPQIHDDKMLLQHSIEKLSATGLISSVASSFIFEENGIFQKIVHALKYQGFQRIGYKLGQQIAFSIDEQLVSNLVVIPIPLHPSKYRERGYNQAELIARGIAAKFNIPLHPNILYRTRYTQTQTKLSLEERKKNMEGAFTLNPHAAYHLQGKICLLVDDVITTGSTILSAARELQKAQPQSIIACSAAVAQYKR